jgi:hypothetical protein
MLVVGPYVKLAKPGGSSPASYLELGTLSFVILIIVKKDLPAQFANRGLLDIFPGHDFEEVLDIARVPGTSGPLRVGDGRGRNDRVDLDGLLIESRNVDSGTTSVVVALILIGVVSVTNVNGFLLKRNLKDDGNTIATITGSRV